MKAGKYSGATNSFKGKSVAAVAGAANLGGARQRYGKQRNEVCSASKTFASISNWAQ